MNAVEATLTGVEWQPSASGGSITATSVPQASTIYVKCTSTQQTVTHDVRGPAPQESEEKNCTVQISIWGPPKEALTDYPEPSKLASNSLRPLLFTIHLNCSSRNSWFFSSLSLLSSHIILAFAVFFLVGFCPGTCKESDTLNLQITSANQSVTFACGANQNLTPQLFDKVCETDTCDSQALLAHTLSGASMVQHASQKGKTDTSAYTLTVPNLPDQAKTLYYKCAGTTNQGGKVTECKIAIAVAQAEAGDGSSGLSSETTTIPPEASGSSAGKWSTTHIASLFNLPLVLSNMM
ncbi:SRS domain-containing protein [Neospora caninum Liverpool]|uniref:SRS domain-containing protein n=1 Tax=Neospora caninum (strain Liverpool) TaxID=572307 RepID=F0VKJ7_NEOCL|nr:SRS domain-containing protein [Neospora caninum Liverpool]CBZ54598.1 SRS domain-containing protein [Neospora caninum Liverpool]|eukprot:XP_003884628.1 SRS domain-containing protein [Neospora caninum Liverpool]